MTWKPCQHPVAQQYRDRLLAAHQGLVRERLPQAHPATLAVAKKEREAL